MAQAILDMFPDCISEFGLLGCLWAVACTLTAAGWGWVVGGVIGRPQ
jgi:hypothetical protein